MSGDSRQLIAQAISDPAGAFEAALDSDDLSSRKPMSASEKGRPTSPLDDHEITGAVHEVPGREPRLVSGKLSPHRPAAPTTAGYKQQRGHGMKLRIASSMDFALVPSFPDKVQGGAGVQRVELTGSRPVSNATLSLWAGGVEHRPRRPCPMCRGLRSCPECDGLGDDTCPECRGSGNGCDQCQGSGRVVCKPCRGSGACPRCGGEGEIELATEG